MEKQVEMFAADNKRQITAVLVKSLPGDFLHLQHA